MKEIRETKLVETAITKITYQSDDGNCTSEDREKVELYEAYQKSKLMPICNFYLPEKSNPYFIFKINSRDDLLVYKDSHKDARIYFDGFRDGDIPEKLNGYFISHYDNDYDNVNYELTHIDRFIKYLEESIEEDRKTLKQQEDAMTVLNNIYKEGV